MFLMKSVSLGFSLFNDVLGTLERERLRKDPKAHNPMKTEETHSCEIWVRHVSMDNRGKQYVGIYS